MAPRKQAGRPDHIDSRLLCDWSRQRHHRRHHLGAVIFQDATLTQTSARHGNGLAAQRIEAQNAVVSAQVFPALQRDGHIAVRHQEIVEFAQ
jgi:hypothetical protein